MRSISAVAALSVLLTAASANAQTVAASHTGDGFLGSTLGLSIPAAGYQNTGVGQTFLSHASGSLQTISVRMAGFTFQPVTVRLYTLGNPLGTYLGQATLPFLSVPSQSANVAFNFSASAIQLAAGQSYAFTISVPTGSSNPNSGVIGDSNASYAEGSGLISFDATTPNWYFSSYDYSFSVTVTTPPPPTCAADFNADGTLDPDDLADYISAFFAQPPAAGSDFNGDSTTDPDDLADYITAFFTGC